MARKIVWVGDDVFGRYHLEGTDIPLALIKADILEGIDVLSQYSFINLTESECEAIRTFPFPPIRNLSLRQTYIVMVLECPCGEDVTLYGEQNPQTVVDCVCGRSWSVGLSVTPVEKALPLDSFVPQGKAKSNGSVFDRIESLR